MSEDMTMNIDGIDVEAPKPAKAKKTKKEKKSSKPVFPQVDNTDETIYPFSVEVPEGFEFGKFQGLKKRDFKEEHIYTLYRASEFEYRAAKLREEAEKIKSLGGSKARSKAKRLIKLREQFAALEEQLRASLGDEAVTALLVK